MNAFVLFSPVGFKGNAPLPGSFFQGARANRSSLFDFEWLLHFRTFGRFDLDGLDAMSRRDGTSKALWNWRRLLHRSLSWNEWSWIQAVQLPARFAGAGASMMRFIAPSAVNHFLFIGGRVSFQWRVQ